VTIRVNDENRDVHDAATLQELLDVLGQSSNRGIAIAVNDSVVRRTSWANHRLSSGDRVLLIQATQGG
jgi:sulfur carrier protein